MTRKEFMQAGMSKRCWEFYPSGPDGWEWFTFDSDGKVESRQGDARWKRDLAAVTLMADQKEFTE